MFICTSMNENRKQIIVLFMNIIAIKQCVECDKEKEEIIRLELYQNEEVHTGT